MQLTLVLNAFFQVKAMEERETQGTQSSLFTIVIISFLFCMGLITGMGCACLALRWPAVRRGPARRVEERDPPVEDYNACKAASEQSMVVLYNRDSKVYHTDSKCRALRGCSPRSLQLCRYCAAHGVVAQSEPELCHED